MFDNGVEQRINYLRESDFSAASWTTSPWIVDPIPRGIWELYGFTGDAPPIPTYGDLLDRLYCQRFNPANAALYKSSCQITTFK